MSADKTPQEKWDAFVLADDAWQECLERAFGRGAGDARYQPRGKGLPGTVLRELHDAYVTARDAWLLLPVSSTTDVIRGGSK